MNNGASMTDPPRWSLLLLYVFCSFQQSCPRIKQELLISNLAFCNSFITVSMAQNEQHTLFQQKYKQLRKADTPEAKARLISDIRQLAATILPSLEIRHPSNYSRIKREIQQILQSCNNIQYAMQPRPVSQHSSEEVPVEAIYPGAVDYALHQIARKSFQGKKVDPREKEIMEIVEKMKTNLQIMKSVKNLVQKEQGNLRSMEMYIDAAFSNVEQALGEEEEAALEIDLAMVAELRLSIFGFLAMVGYMIMGIPGMIFTFVTGLKFF